MDSAATTTDTLMYAFRTDTGDLIADRPLRCGLYEARLHLEFWLRLNPDVDPRYTVMVERTKLADGSFRDTVHWTDPELGSREANDMMRFAASFTEALDQDLITAADFA